MRIVAGKWAGRTLTSPAGKVRPTTEYLRDAWMNEIAEALEGSRIIDLFAGSGALGIEAMSRGARYADFIENNPAALHALKANIAQLRAGDRARIFKQDAIQFVERLPAGKYDIAFADPPYGSHKADRIVRFWSEVPFANVLCIEHALDHELPGKGRRRRFGEHMVTFFHRRM